MSDCGVCITSGDFDECTGYRCVIVKAGKEWECSECGCKIPKRSPYELASGFNDRDFWQAKTCLICAEIADAFMCHGRWHGGILWDSMDSFYDDLNTACFARLKTVAAKKELQRRWMEAKGIAS